jgi:hypothetical protein
MATSSADIVEEKVIIDAAEAIQSLQNLSSAAMSVDEKMQTLLQEIETFSAKSGASLSAVAAQFKELDATFNNGQVWNMVNAQTDALNTQGEVMDKNVGAWTGYGQQMQQESQMMVEGTTAANDVLNTQGQVMENNVGAWTGYGQQMQITDQATQGFTESEREVAPASEAAAGGINLVNTALRVMTAMLVFEVINAIRQFFTEAISNAQEYYQALVQINVAQSSMAANGIGGTQQDLINIAKELQSIWIDISQNQMYAAVGLAAQLGTQYGLVDSQIKNIVNDAAIMVNTGQAKDMTAAVNDIIAALSKTSGATAKWAADAGISFTSVEMDAEAAKLGIEKIGSAYTEEERVAIDLGIINDNLANKQQSAIAAQQTAAKAGADTTAQWNTLLTNVGQALEPVIYMFQTQLLSALLAVNKSTADWEVILARAVILLAAAAEIQFDTLTGQFGKAIDAFKNAEKAWQDAENTISNAGINPNVNTPTNPNVNPNAEPPITLDKSTIDQALKDYEDYLNTLADDNAKFALQQEQAQASYNNSVLQEIENYDNSVAQEKMNFNLQMQELDQEYTFNLQSALEDRNARQVLTDQAKYSMDKEKLQAEEKLRLEELKMDEQLRLEELAQNYTLEQQKAEEDHQLQLQELQQAEKDKLMALAQSLDQQYNLQGIGVKDIYDLLTSYYGPGGYFDKLQDQSLQSMITKNEEYLKQLQSLISQMQALENQVPGAGGTYSPPNQGGGNRAHGGIDFANTATSLTFGEAGPEMAITIPMGQSYSLPSTSFGGGGNMGGSANVLISLSEGLEGAIVQNTLNEIAITFEKVERSR